MGNAFLSGLSSTVDTAVSSMGHNVSAVTTPVTEVFAPAPSSAAAPGSPPPPSNPARTVQKVAGAALAAVNLPVELMNTGFAVATSAIAAMMPTLPAATIGAMYVGPPHGHAHPPSLVPPNPVPVPLPSLGSVMIGTCVKVLIGGMPAARAGDFGLAPTCCGFAPAFEIFLGSSKVFIGGMRAARMGDISKACTPSGAGAVRGFAAAMMAAGQAVALAGVVADAVDAGSAPDANVAAASGVAAAMGAAQIAADAAALAIMATMGVDPGIPPTPGALVMGSPNVQIGGFPMINFPNPAELLFGKIKAMRAKKKAKSSEDANTGCSACPK